MHCCRQNHIATYSGSGEMSNVVTRASQKLKDDENTNEQKHNGFNDVSTSGSPDTDTSALRSLIRETPTKTPTKIDKVPSPQSTRKSERIEKRKAPTSPPFSSKRKLPSSSGVSDKDGEDCTLSSLGAKKSKKSSSMDTELSKDHTAKGGLEPTVTVGGFSKKSQDRSSTVPVKKIKPMNALSYRKKLTPRAKEVKEPGLSKKLNGQDESFQGNTENSIANGHHVIDDHVKETESITSRIESQINVGMQSIEDRDKDDDEAIPSPRGTPGKTSLSNGEKTTYQVNHQVKKKSDGVAENEFFDIEGEKEITKSCLEVLGGGVQESIPIREEIVELTAIGDTEQLVVELPIIGDAQQLVVELPTIGDAQQLVLEPMQINSSAEKILKLLHPGLESTSNASVMVQNIEICTINGTDNVLSKDRRGDEISSKATVIRNCSEDGEVEMQPSVIQNVTNIRACFICKLGENLRNCAGKGCKQSYHIYCLDPPLKYVPPGIWFCLSCTKKKILSGVHSTSEGVESVWNAREEEPTNCDGIRKQKHMQYFVKYRGLAHVHNCWITEEELLLEAPVVLAEFKRNQAHIWKLEWNRPERLLQKRLLMSETQRNQQFSDLSDCSYEWFVKWTCLGYEHATWELENASFLRSHEALTLIEDYENRLEKSKRVCKLSRADKEMNSSLTQLLKLPDIGMPVSNHHLSFINKLYEYWHKGQSAVISDDQDRVLKVILFILSLQSNTCKPFLIISSSPAIYTWETEFLRLVPSVNVVVYNGNRDVRGIIRAVEFYSDDGYVMIQILVSPPEVIVEDLEFIKSIGWEAIVVDECQRYRVSKHLEVIKAITTQFKLLLVTGSVKESIPEYLNLLSFIDSKGDKNGCNSTNDNIGKLKERFAHCVVCDRKGESSRFVEYWVPVRLSNVQLEQYCRTLLTNFALLRSSSKSDPVDAFRDTLITIRKCCDHPYVMDPSLQNLLTARLGNEDILEIGIKSCGKLLFLDKFLSEVQKLDSKVLIIFQSISASRSAIGDIIEDFVRQKFGYNSFERIDSGLQPQRKQAAMNMFNEKEKGRFIFLLEHRACLPSIKLSMVDAVVLYNSDWNPSNDLRTLQRIHLDSGSKPIKIFRLYSSCTVEEKALVLAKQDKAIDGNTQSINGCISQSLLMWGASHLLNKLDEFHASPPLDSNIVFEQSFVDDVVQELMTQLHPAATSNNANCLIGNKVLKIGTTYSNDIILLGEKEMQGTNEDSLVPHVYWTNLLNGKYPQWRYLAGSSQRVRKKPQHLEDGPSEPVVDANEVGKKRRRLVNIIDDRVPPKSRLEDKGKVSSLNNQESGYMDGSDSQASPCSTASLNDVDINIISNDIARLTGTLTVEHTVNLSDIQKSLHHTQKQQISDLCKVLQLPEKVNSMAQKFLEYNISTRRMLNEPETLFQAFQISLCWSAASLLKHKISRTESLEITKERLGFRCKLEEAKQVHKKLRELEKKFICHISSSSKDVEEDVLHVMQSQSAQSEQQELENGEFRVSCPSVIQLKKQVSDKLKQTIIMSEMGSGSGTNDFAEIIKEVNEICNKRTRYLAGKLEEYNKIKKEIMESKKADLLEKHRVESIVVRATTQISRLDDKMRKLGEKLDHELKELDFEFEAEMQEAEGKLDKVRDQERKFKDHWLNEAKAGRSVALFSMLPLPDSGLLAETVSSEQDGVPVVLDKTISMPAVLSSETHDSAGDVSVIQVEVKSAVVINKDANEAEVDIPTETTARFTYPDGMNKGTEIRTSEEVALSGANRHRNASESWRFESLGQTQIDPSSEANQVPFHQIADGEEHLRLSSSNRLQSDHLSNCEVPTISSGIDLNQVVSADEQLQPSISERVQVDLFLSCEVPSTSQLLKSNQVMSAAEHLQVSISERVQDDHTSIEIPCFSQQLEHIQVIYTEVHPQASSAERVLGDPTSICEVPSTSQLLESNQVLTAEQHPQPSISDRVQGDQVLSTSQHFEFNQAANTEDHPQSSVSESVHEGRKSSCEVWSTSHVLDNRVASAEEHHQHSISDRVQDDHISSCEVLSTSQQIQQCSQSHGKGHTSQPSSDAILSNLAIPASVDAHQFHLNPPAVGDIVSMEQRVENQRVLSQPQLERETGLRQTSAQQAPVPQPSSGDLTVRFDRSIPQLNTPLYNPRSMGSISEYSNRTAQTGSIAFRTPSPFSVDPLENELDKIRKEDEISKRKYELKKIELTTNYEKEMDELRKKYETLSQDAEIAFVENRQTRENNYQRINLNKMLANTFHFKCNHSNAKSSGSASPQQGHPGSVQQTSQRSSLPISQRSMYAPHQSAIPAAALPTISQTAPTMQVIHSPMVSVPPQPQVTNHLSPAPVSSPVLVANNHSPAPISTPVSRPLQGVHSSVLFSNKIRPHYNSVSPIVSHQVGTVVRAPPPPPHPSPVVSHPVGTEVRTPPPHLNPVVSHLVGSEIRAPPPHLQRFRPNPLPTNGIVPGQQSHKSPSQTPPAPSYNTFGPFSRMHPNDAIRGPTPAPCLSKFSHIELLRGVDNRQAENQENLLPSLDDSNADAWVVGKPITSTPTATTPTTSDVVCLSDDD